MLQGWEQEGVQEGHSYRFKAKTGRKKTVFWENPPEPFGTTYTEAG